MKLEQIIKANARQAGYISIDINRGYEWVTITDNTREYEEIFLQGHAASQFIAEVDKLANMLPDTDFDTLERAAAYDYVSCLWG